MVNKNREDLRPIICTKCGRILISAIAGVKVYCPKCRVWTNNNDNGGEINV